jgi:hypothetical protein
MEMNTVLGNRAIHPGSGVQRRSARAGRKKQEHTRCERVVGQCYPEDKRDLQALCEAWDVPESALVWAVLHEWLCEQRVVSTQLGEVRGRLKAVLELALRDTELRPWLLGLIREGSER